MAFPDGGAIVSTGQLSVESRGRLSPDPGSFARADVASVSLFGGEITAGRVYVQAGARATVGAAGGQLTASTIESLVVLGEPVDAAPNQQIPLGDWGYVVVLEQAVVTEGAPTPGYRGFVVGLHVHLTAEHAGLPAGTQILVGYAEAAVRSGGSEPLALDEEPAPAPPEPVEPEPAETVEPPAASPNPQPEPPSPPRESEPPARPATPAPAPEPPAPAPVQPPASAVEAQLTGEGFVFPVYGPASFTDDFGAARASTGWHHGNDIFAPLGAPVLAVTDGELFLVGWNTVGGHRLWLRDDDGNEYYFAHLSAYAPIAENGARVSAGDVLGFVGASGDAAGTPPHLHFEVHPVELLDQGYDGVVNPFSHLSAWQRALDAEVSFAQSLPQASEGEVAQAPLPAAVPLGFVDISFASGLDGAGLERVLSFPSAIVEESYSLLTLPGRSPITDAEPGFSAR